jgi:hypothetical protein
MEVLSMAKIKGPLFSIGASGSFGDIVFDRRGYAYLKPERRDARTASQGDFRQALMVAQKCAGICGSATRQQLKALAESPSHWSSFLTRHFLGPRRAAFMATLTEYAGPAVDQAAWEAAAVSMGLKEVYVAYANEAGVSPGAQLFALASTLFGLGLYPGLGKPNGQAEVWKEKIISLIQ